VDRDEIARRVIEALEQAYETKRAAIGPQLMPQLERTVLLSIVDAKWKDHLYMMDALREGIHLRAYGQRDPLVEYQREAYRMFQDMIEAIKAESLMMLLRVQPVAEPQAVSVFARTPQQEVHPAAPTLATSAAQQPPQAAAAPSPPLPTPPGRPQPPTPIQQHTGPKVGRNDPCPCGSHLKYKKCHGK
jgi:preprotein translocase subunit SecA